MTGDLPPTARTRRVERLEAVFTAVRTGDLATAKRLARAALAQGLEHPTLLNLRALEFEDAGMFREALADLRRAHLLSPQDHTILNACGLCLVRMDRAEEALRCYDQAVAIAPDFGQAWFNRGWPLERLGEITKATQTYARAADINPENAEAWANLAALDVRRGNTTAARVNAEKALALQPGHPTAILALAAIEIAEPEVAQARLKELLSGPLTPLDRAIAIGQLGDVLDALDKPAQAFDAYRTSNSLFREQSAPRFERPGQPTVGDAARWFTEWARNLDAMAWAAGVEDHAGEAGEAGHVFLLGFPRSGTTLIENVLASHPAVTSVEELETLAAGVVAYASGPDGPKRLDEATATELQRSRDAYWARVRELGVDPVGKVFVDKNPFNTLKLPIILKLFPKAKILFAVRDPRDVLLSCYRRRFQINSSTFQYLDLGQTATSYASAMGLAELLRAKIHFDEYQLVYERLVAEFGSEARAVCAFIGVEWDDALVDFADRARRGDVASASSAQIARGLYAGGAGQWRRYQAQLAPVLPILAPWVERFGYPAE